MGKFGRPRQQEIVLRPILDADASSKALAVSTRQWVQAEPNAPIVRISSRKRPFQALDLLVDAPPRYGWEYVKELVIVYGWQVSRNDANCRCGTRCGGLHR